MSIKFLLKIFPFTMLIHNIFNNLEASYTDIQSNDNNRMENNNIPKNRLKNKSKDKNINTVVDKNTSDNNETEADSNTDSSESGKDNNDLSERQSDDDTKSSEADDDDTDSEDDSKDEEDDFDDDSEDKENDSEEDEDDSDVDNDSDDDSEDEDDDSDEDEDDENDEDDSDDEDDDEDEEEDLYADKDPLEPINRKIHNFNESLNNLFEKFKSKDEDNNNKNKSKNISKAIGNFSHNFFEFPRIINYGLQGNIKNMANTIARLIINTAFGFFGVTDVAEKLGFPKNNTYFGDTLKKWGMKPGPYVVLPILGPTSLRGAVGKAFEALGPQRAAILPLNNTKPITKNTIFYAIYCSSLLATRSAYSDMIKQVSAMSKDTYKTFRNITMSMESN